MAQRGRKKGVPNLRYTDNGIVNMHGVTFTPEEKKKLESLVNSATRKRREQLREAAKLPRYYGGMEVGGDVKDLQLMGKESDFIITPKFKSLQRFQSREQFENYMDYVKKVNSPTYLDDRTRMYKANYIKALRENYEWDACKDVVMKIRMMKPSEFRELATKDEILEIKNIYPAKYAQDDDAMLEQLNELRAGLGMQPKDEYLYD